MKNIPEKIYLQIGEGVTTKEITKTDIAYATWHSERVRANDLEYVLASQAEKAKAFMAGFNECSNLVADKPDVLPILTKVTIKKNGKLDLEIAEIELTKGS